MCGILAILCPESYPRRTHVDAAISALHKRGPDQSGLLYLANAVIGHARLAIVNPETKAQPIVTKEWVIAINGEIYNSNYKKGIGTDCDAIISALNDNTIADLNGQFAFAAFNKRSQHLIIGRDRAGIAPLYVAYDSNKRVWVSSLIAAFPKDAFINAPAPGTISCFDSRTGEKLSCVPFVEPYPALATAIPFDFNIMDLRQQLVRAVQLRIPEHVPFAFLLSGGLDSTIIACIARMLMPNATLNTFCIGLKDSPDLKAAEEVARHIKSNHKSITYTVAEGLQALPDVIKCIETYDQTTVRASTPMYLLLNIIRRHGFKVVMSGEGADEVFAGYLYNHAAPHHDDLQQECVVKLKKLYSFDCLRANKCCLGNSVEVRVPFLDNNLVQFAMTQVHPVHKMSGSHPDGPRIEKHILREAFKDILPPVVYTRTKAQFSDAVGDRWIKTLQDNAVKICHRIIKSPFDDEDVAEANRRSRAEKRLYKEIFLMHYGHVNTADAIVVEDKSIACSTAAALKWSTKFEKFADPSGDAVQRAFKDQQKSSI